MLVKEGLERTETIDLWLACSLSSVAGALNAATFYADGFFSANMTGNVSILSNRLALGQWSNAPFYIAILAAFICGSACSALLINVGRSQTRRIYAYGILIEGFILSGIGCTDLWVPVDLRVSVIVLGVAFAMGFQNAIGTKLSDARVRTTHISGLATDIGIELAAAAGKLFGAQGSNATDNLGKLRLQASTVLAFLLGGIGGVLLFRFLGSYMLILTAAILFGIAAPAIIRWRRPGTQTAA